MGWVGSLAGEGDAELAADLVGRGEDADRLVQRQERGVSGPVGDELGQVKEGYLADLLLVDDDPLKNIAVMIDRTRFAMIMKNGEMYKDPASYVAAEQRIAAE